MEASGIRNRSTADVSSVGNGKRKTMLENFTLEGKEKNSPETMSVGFFAKHFAFAPAGDAPLRRPFSSDNSRTRRGID